MNPVLGGSRRSSRGASTTEYALMMTMMGGLLAVGVTSSMGDYIESMLSCVTVQLSERTTSCSATSPHPPSNSPAPATRSSTPGTPSRQPGN